jgi:glycosyltransferase involved in cell wall biosynthesis
MSSLLLSFFPLPAAACTDESLPRPVEAMSLAGLRPKGLRGAMRAMRGSRHDLVRFVVTSSDPAGLRAIADLALFVTRGERRERADVATGRIEVVSFPDALAASARFAIGLLAGMWSVAANAVEAAFMRRRRALSTNWGEAVSRGPVGYLRGSFGLPSVGGSVGHTSGVVNALARMGMAPHVFACTRPVGIRDECTFTAVPIPATSCYPNELNAHRYSRRFGRRVSRELRARRPAFLYQRYVLNDMSGVRLARRLRLPFVLEYSGSEVWIQKNWGRPILLAGLSKSMEDLVLRHADLVVTVSQPLEDELRSRGIAAERILFYPNCVDAREFDPDRYDDSARQRVRGELGLEGSSLVATFVGTFGAWHGAEVFAEAVRLLPDDVEGRHVRCLFVGDGPGAPRVRQILEVDLRSEKAVMAGARPQGEAPSILASSDILVSPHVPNKDGSAFFGSPTKLFEYMAMAKPIVASDLDQIGSVLRGWTPGGGEPGLDPFAILVRPGDPQALAEGLTKAFRLTPLERADLGRRARAQVLRAFRWEDCVGAVVHRLETLAGTTTPVLPRGGSGGAEA